MAKKREPIKGALYCPYCDAEIAEATFPYCEACGVAVFTCPKCHETVSRENKVCPKCGIDIRKETQESG